MTRLFLWRHGQTEWNAASRVQGQSDIGLSAMGREQATRTAPRLAACNPHALISSDLRRTADTAAVLAAQIGLRVEVDPRLRERGYGEWEGLTLPEIQNRWPAEFVRWRSGDPAPGCGMEHYDVLAKRVAEALREIADRYPGGTVVVTTHGGAARAGTAELLGWPSHVRRSLGGLGNCHWTELRFHHVRGWQLRTHNVG